MATYASAPPQQYDYQPYTQQGQGQGQGQGQVQYNPQQPYANQPVYAQPQQQYYAQPIAVTFGLTPSQGKCCGCKNTCCNPYLNFMLLIMTTLSAVSCIVALTSELHYLKISPSSTLSVTSSFFRDHAVVGGVSTSYSDLDSSNKLSACKSAGDGLTGGAVVSFIFLVLSAFFTISRIFNVCGGVVRSIGGYRRVAVVEGVFVVLSAVAIWVAAVIWGIQCFEKTQEAANDYGVSSYSYEIGATGYAFLNTCAILMVIACVHIGQIRSNPYFSSFGREDTYNVPVYVQQQQYVPPQYVAPQ